MVQNRSQIWGLGPHFRGSGWSFWVNFGGPGVLWLPSASWEPFWAALGRFQEPRWLQLEAQDGSKLEPEWHKNRCKNRIFFDAFENQIVMEF